VSQPLVSESERGLGASSSVATWAVLAAAVGSELAAFVEAAPGADRPRDHEHLRRQEALIAFARPGGWRPAPELVLGPARWARSIDVALTRPATREAVVVEVWDWLDDVGAAMRSLGAKVEALQARLGPEWRVRGLFVVRATARNRQLVREFRGVFASRFPGGSRAWLRALGDPTAPMPARDGLAWSVSGGSHLRAARLLSSAA